MFLSELRGELELCQKNHYSKKVREVLPLFKENGFQVVGINGSHIKFKDDIGNTIVVNQDLNRMVRKRIEKEIIFAGKNKSISLNIRGKIEFCYVKGYIHSNGCSGYNKLMGIIRCGCWVHLRRKYDGKRPEKLSHEECKSNNAAENAICSFIVGSKNWLFADTPKGASASAVVYWIVETAKANEINLQYLLLYMLDTDWRNHPEELNHLIPWSVMTQAECK